MMSVTDFEEMLVRSEIKLFKYYLDISREVQEERLAARRADPLKQWKISPIDDRAIELWTPYSDARNEMLERTHTALTPWTIVRADRKRSARLNLIRNLLRRLDYEGKTGPEGLQEDPGIAFRYDVGVAGEGGMAP
jgi:polyphosphate kinase 2 (PPK2 family)